MKVTWALATHWLAGWLAMVYALYVPTCGGTTCYTIRNGTAGMPTVATYAERVLQRTVIIGVAARDGMTGGTFDLSTELTPL